MNWEDGIKPSDAWVRMRDNPALIAILTEIGQASAQTANLLTLVAFLEHLVKLYATDAYHDMHYQEAIFPDKPCRIYMDCDRKLKQVDGVWEQVDEAEFVDFIHAQVCSILARSGDITKEVRYPTILRATRPDKFSVHLLWDTCAEKPADVRGLVAELVQHSGVTIDVLPYPVGTSPKSLRMPWCAKKSRVERNCSVHHLIPTTGQRHFTPEAFCSHLITHFATTHTAWDLYLPPVPTELYKNPLVNGRMRYRDIDQAEVGDDFRSLTFEWLEATNPVAVSKPTLYTDGSYRGRVNMYCQVAGRWHARNPCFVCVDRFGCGSTICLDESCGVVLPLPYNDAQLRVCETPAMLDWNILSIIVKSRKAARVEDVAVAKKRSRSVNVRA